MSWDVFFHVTVIVLSSFGSGFALALAIVCYQDDKNSNKDL